MRSDPYREFAEVYDAWQKLYPRPFSLAIAPRVRAAVRDHGAPVRTLADLACGTGTFGLWWKRTHRAWRVYGTDRSEAMIRRARRAARAAGEAPVRFLVQDLKSLSLPEPVGVATCLFDSLNHVTRLSDLRLILRGVARTLDPGGLFVFDLVDERYFAEVFTGSSILNTPDLYVGTETEFAERRGHGAGMARFTFFRREGARHRRIEFTIRERRWLQGQIRQLLDRAGLEVIALEKISPYASPELFIPRTFWVCRKPT